MNIFTLVRWSPYLTGFSIGVLSLITFIIADRPIGVSTAFVRLSGLLEKLLIGKKIENKPYYKKYVPNISWEVMLLIGIIIGSFLSAIFSGQFSFELVPELWITKFGFTPILRLFVALIGGFFVGFGARWAGGCTSGHGISGTMQLAVTSWLAAISFFVGGIITALLLY